MVGGMERTGIVGSQNLVKRFFTFNGEFNIITARNEP